MKQKWIAIILAALCLFTACSQAPQEEESSVSSQTPATKDDYIDLLCGYYEQYGTYLHIEKDWYEEVDPQEHWRFSNSVESIEIALLAEGGVSYSLYLTNNPGRSPLFQLTAEGTITRPDGSPLTVITKEAYEAATASVPESTAEEAISSPSYEEDEMYDPDAGGSIEMEVPWYVTEFNTYEIEMRLTEIDNLFAVGKKDQAVKAFDQQIIGLLDDKIDELIGRREYFLAQNYVGMIQHYLGTNNSNDYSFVEDYLDETVENSTDKMMTCGINILAHKYYSKIRNAALADKNVLSREECVYVMNQFLLDNGRSTVTGLWHDVHKEYCAYYTETLVNTEPVEYLFINPYNQNVWVFPVEYYFIQGHQYNVG